MQRSDSIPFILSSTLDDSESDLTCMLFPTEPFPKAFPSLYLAEDIGERENTTTFRLSSFGIE
jgi:hypothetical protein